MNKNNIIILSLAMFGFALSIYVEYLFLNANDINIVYALNMAWSVLYVYLVAYILNANNKGGGKRQKQVINNFIYGYTYYCAYIFIILLLTEIIGLPLAIEQEYPIISGMLFVFFVILYPLIKNILLLVKKK